MPRFVDALLYFVFVLLALMGLDTKGTVVLLAMLAKGPQASTYPTLTSLKSD